MSWRGTLPPACWEANEAERIIPTEAESPSDAAFLATHTSIPVFQRDVVVNDNGASETDESALLQAILEQPADQPILPILGSSGTGKSHLVRWVRAKLPDQPSRRVIFVPKHRMSLRGVLDLILQHATGDRADELRHKVATAAEGFDNEEVARLRLRSELALLIETEISHSDSNSEEQTLRKYLSARDGLPALLGDEVFRDALLSESGPISRLVREKLRGRGAEDKEDGFGFTPEDLIMSVDDMSRAGAAAKIMAHSLTGNPEVREIAAQMLNEQLGPAISRVFGIGGDDLKDLLVEVRSEFKKQGLELLLLIEDFSIFQGIQGGLLDAITLIPTQGNDICAMRVVMAVTTGYFQKQMPDTVYTRVYKVFDLDARTARVTFSPESLAARYMNAIRVGSANLEQAHSDKADVPNACDQCPVNDACHKAFGAVDGYGLFPFNAPALDKAVSSKLVDDRLSVRDFLTRVLRPVLFNSQSDINTGNFPSRQFDDLFRKGALGVLDSVEDEHRLSTPGDPEVSQRRVNLVRYWGPKYAGPQNLVPVIHEAFQVPPIPGLQEADTFSNPAPDSRPAKTTSESTPPVPPRPEQRSPSADPPLVQAIDHWRGTNEMRQDHKNDLRNLIHSAVVARLMFDDGLGGSTLWTDPKKQWDPSFAAQHSIKIGEGQPLTEPLITIERTDSNAIRVLRALAMVNAKGAWDGVESGELLQIIVEEQVSAWAVSVSQRLIPHRDKNDDPEIAVVAQTLLAISKSYGIPGAFKDDSLSRVAALFAPLDALPIPPRPKLRDWQQRTAHGTQRLGRDQLQQRLLRLASFTQGTGESLALDLSRLTKVLRGKEIGSNLPAVPGLVGETSRSVERLMLMLPTLRDEASTLIPDLGELGGDLADAIKQLDALVSERTTKGQLQGVDQVGLTAAGKAIRQGDQTRILELRAKLRDWDALTLDQQIRLLTDDWDATATRVRHWQTMAATVLRALDARLGNRNDSTAQVEYEQTRTALLSTLQKLVEILDPSTAERGRL